MSDIARERLMDDLVADLTPVRRAGSPWTGACAWMALVVALALALAAFADLPAIARRLTAVPDMWLALAGSTMTAGLAAAAAFQLARPDGSRLWAALPLPGLALWVGASGMGCARSWLLPGTTDASMAETMHCLRFILCLSVPLSVAMIWLLRRGYSFYPTLTGGMVGLAVAAAAASLLAFFHPFDASLADLAVHAGAVAIVVLGNRALGGRLLGRTR